jgi:hypothetical protein
LDTTPADLTVSGDDAGDSFGSSVAAGDVDGDTTEDLIVGAYLAGDITAETTLAGETYVAYGGGSLPSTIDLDSTSADVTVYGTDAGDESGGSVAAGDIDGDTTDDLIIGARQADGSGSGTSCGTGQVGDWCEAGETYVIYGGSLPSTIDLDSTSADVTVYGNSTSGWAGASVAAGDIDGDSIADLIIGAPLADPTAGRDDAGETYVIYAAGGLPSIIDVTTADLTVGGDDVGDGLGWSVAVGDVDGDSFGDLVIGAPLADPAGGTDAGEVYVIYGGDSLSGGIDLDNESAGLTVYGDDDYDTSGICVATGDMDGDTGADLIIGADGGDGSGSGSSCDGTGDRCDAGEAYVIYGDTPPTPTPTPTSVATLTPTPAPTPCADLNGDGLVTLADLIIDVTYFMQTVPPAPPQADLNGDLMVLASDILAVFAQFNTATTCQDDPIGPKGTPKPTPTAAPTPPPEAEMSLTVKSAGADCDDPSRPAKCAVPPGSQFTLSVEVIEPSVKGYVGIQTQVVYGPLKYKPTEWGQDETVWPGAVPPYGVIDVRIPSSPTGQEGVVHHFAASAALPPHPVSTYTDNIVDIVLNCPLSGSYKIALPVLSLTNPWGSHFVKPNMTNAVPTVVGQQDVDVDGDTTPELVDVAAALTINCGKLPPPGDTDGDGCPDVDENGPDEMYGGRRDYMNPWDYFNPTNDGQNRVDDILAVVNQYFEDEFLPSPPNPPDTPNPDYSGKYDRTSLGPDPWNLGPPNGQQRVDDILHAVNSYFHDCGSGIAKPTPTATPTP